MGSRQRACFTAECQEKRGAAAREVWRSRNPDYFRGRGVKHRAYRARKKAGGEPAGVAEQDAITGVEEREQDEIGAQVLAPQWLEVVLGRLVGAEGEQDAILAQARVLIGLIAFREGYSAEQDELGVLVAMLDNVGRRILERVVRPARLPERAVPTLARGGGPP